MKKITKTVLCFIVFCFLSTGKVSAVLNPGIVKDTIDQKIETVPIVVVSPIKTPIKVEKVIDIDKIMPLATKTPTPIVVTQVVTATPAPATPTTEVKPTKAEKITPEATITADEETLGDDDTKAEEKTTEEGGVKINSDKWFWIIIVGLLALILIVQVWSTKRNEENKSKKE